VHIVARGKNALLVTCGVGFITSQFKRRFWQRRNLVSLSLSLLERQTVIYPLSRLSSTIVLTVPLLCPRYLFSCDYVAVSMLERTETSTWFALTRNITRSLVTTLWDCGELRIDGQVSYEVYRTRHDPQLSHTCHLLETDRGGQCCQICRH
jgi:hypothetical protein